MNSVRFTIALVTRLYTPVDDNTVLRRYHPVLFRWRSEIANAVLLANIRRQRRRGFFVCKNLRPTRNSPCQSLVIFGDVV